MDEEITNQEETGENKLIFSLVTGDIYEIEVDELKNLDKHQLPLVKRPPRSCKKCYGRMYWGFNTVTQIYDLCPKCKNKCIDFRHITTDEIDIETLKPV